MTANNSIDPARFLSEHLERAEPDLLRSMLGTFIDALMGAEADALCGAPYGVRSEDRVNSRNGYRSRDWDTRAGTMEVAIPKLRSCGSGYRWTRWPTTLRPTPSRRQRTPYLYSSCSALTTAWTCGAPLSSSSL